MIHDIGICCIFTLSKKQTQKIMKTETLLIQKWNSLTNQQKSSFGDRWITHETNLNAWAKDFDSLSELKKKRVIENIGNINPEHLNFMKGSGIA